MQHLLRLLLVVLTLPVLLLEATMGVVLLLLA
jgi:hypothetical protein